MPTYCAVFQRLFNAVIGLNTVYLQLPLRYDNFRIRSTFTYKHKLQLQLSCLIFSVIWVRSNPILCQCDVLFFKGFSMQLSV